VFVAQRGRRRGGPVVVVVGGLQLTEGVVPVGFEAVGDEPVVGVDGEVTATGQAGVVPGRSR
jgi:hypothetical protein